MTIEEVWQKASSEKVSNLMGALRQRWQDEREYEDINDYLVAIQQLLPEAYKIHKRPFGVTCKCDDGDLKVYFKAKGKYLQMCGDIIKED